MIDTEAQIFKDIESGKYRDYYLIYNRKSTDEPDNQKNSLSYQKSENLRFAKRENLPIAPITTATFFNGGVISEKQSAYKQDNGMVLNDDFTVQFNIERPKFHRMSQLLFRRLFKGVVFLCWDRASRNPADDLILKKLQKTGIDIKFVLATYDKTSSGELHQDIDGMFAGHHSRVTSEKVTITGRKNRSDGICTYRAPVGYLNLGTMDNKPFDPERAPILKKIFELADNNWSLADLARFAIEQGFTMSPSRKRRTAHQILLDEENDEPSHVEKVCTLPKYTTIQRILRNRFYTGVIQDVYGNWIPSKSHKALVTTELFERIQEKLTNKNKSKKYNLPLPNPFRGQFICKSCNRSYTPYFKKGNVYLGCRCVVGCTNTNKSLNIDFIEKNISTIIESLYFNEAEKRKMDARIKTYLEVLENSENNKTEETNNRKKKLTEDLAYLQENKLTLLKTGVYTPEAFLVEERKLGTAINNISNIEHVSVTEIKETVENVYKLSELLKDFIPQWEYANSYEKQDLIKIMFSELSVSENTLDYKVTKGLVPIKSRMFSLCAGGGT